MTRMHANEISLTADQVKRIVSEQFPRWRHLEIAPVRSSGTENRIFRLGDRLSARFPLVVDDPEKVLDHLLIEAEAEREILGRTRVPTPEPVALGQASSEYPAPWAVKTWLPGRPAIDADLSGSTAFVRDVVELITEVRSLPVRGRSHRGYGRGGDLRFAEDWMDGCFSRSDRLLDVPRLRDLWRELRELPRTDADVMTHGDVLPTNLLVDGEALVGVLDVGGLGPADPALDLMSAWNLFDQERRQLLRDALECSDLEWARGRAWAFQQAMGTVWYYRESNPAMSEMGRRALVRILEE
jgi:aminoglycoside phosphotransferase (APT) family kinase protein